MPNKPETLAERIKRSREEAGLTQEQLAAACGITSAAIGLVEIGDTKTLKSAHLFKMARALRKNPEWLANGSGFETHAQHTLDDIVGALPQKVTSEVLNYIKYRVSSNPELIAEEQRRTYITSLDQRINREEK